MKKMTTEYALAVISACIEKGDFKAIEREAKAHAFPNNKTVVKALAKCRSTTFAYVFGRRLKGFLPKDLLVREILTNYANDNYLVRLSCIGNSLSADNELLFIKLFINNENMLRRYLSKNPRECVFKSKTLLLADEELYEKVRTISDNYIKDVSEGKEPLPRSLSLDI